VITIVKKIPDFFFRETVNFYDIVLFQGCLFLTCPRVFKSPGRVDRQTEKHTSTQTDRQTDRDTQREVL